MGRERADHARSLRRVRKLACTLLTRAPQPSPKPTRESTLLTHPERATSGRSDAPSEQLRVVWSRGSCCSSGDGERRRLPGDSPPRNARVAADKRDKRTVKRTASQSLRRTRSRISLWCAALLRALRCCLAVSRCGYSLSVAKRVDCCLDLSAQTLPCCCARRNGAGCLFALSCQLVTVRTMLPHTVRSATSIFQAPSREAR